MYVGVPAWLFQGEFPLSVQVNVDMRFQLDLLCRYKQVSSVILRVKKINLILQLFSSRQLI